MPETVVIACVKSDCVPAVLAATPEAMAQPVPAVQPVAAAKSAFVNWLGLPLRTPKVRVPALFMMNRGPPMLSVRASGKITDCVSAVNATDCTRLDVFVRLIEVAEVVVFAELLGSGGITQDPFAFK